MVLRALRRLWVLPACLVLSGCGMVSLGYPRLPDLGLLYVQRQVSLNDAQAEQVREDLQQLLAWHRRTQLLPTADLLRRWHTLAATDLSAEQLCREADTVRDLLGAMAPQALPGLVRLAQSMDADQRQALARAQQRQLSEFREAHLGPPPAKGWLASARANPVPSSEPTPATRAASLERRLDSATDRYERLYGRLNTAQRQALRESLAQSSFDAQRLLAERERRSQDLLQAVANTAQTTAAAPSATGTEPAAPLRGWLARLQTSPTPGHTAYGLALQREGCAQMATVHRLATPEQRQHAMATLAGYEADLRRLAQP